MLKKPNSNSPPCETRVSSPERDWFAEMVVKAAREVWKEKHVMMRERERHNCGFLFFMLSEWFGWFGSTVQIAEKLIKVDITIMCLVLVG